MYVLKNLRESPGFCFEAMKQSEFFHQRLYGKTAASGLARRLPLFFLGLMLFLRPVAAGAWPEEVAWALHEDRPELALHVLRSWSHLSADPEDRALALWMEARILALHMGDTGGAETALDRVLTAYPGSRIQGDVRFEKGFLALQRGERERASREFAAFVAAFPDHPRRQSAGDFLRDLRGQISEPLLGSPDRIRVALSFSENHAQLSGKGLHLRDMATGGLVFSGDRLTLLLDEGGHIRLDGRIVGQPLILDSGSEGFVLNGRRHRGSLQVHGAGGRLLLVNVLDLENYLRGVVPAEMPPSWPMEALKAQAVAARTYALHHMRNRAYAAYDVKADTRSQMFITEREDPRSDAAITATQGEVLTWAGQAAFTAFHADSGGNIEAAETVWGGEFPYLTAFSDPWTRNTPNAFWTCVLTEKEMQQALPELRGKGRILDLRVEGKTPSGRVETLVARTSKGEIRIPATRFRTLIGPMVIRSTDFSLSHKREGFHFQGRGFGHGAGMSQWGARRMAEEGKNYQDILRFYYPLLHRQRM
ncbi:SpoIID/LytB domain-containing protein [Desulfobotulus sp.]|uniref:SpoIID/LytB domain-containing protein n=1 Tax=Desulfobotulus sp. TaxID=1940337 RepID=UPI002A36429F|nr:SpoIID/LytB domain-containing protein [Desulfobotulus sp.]MDY0163226.1 SpoIID/LytB domain-containing protein [Desulfobotulus sp.]